MSGFDTRLFAGSSDTALLVQWLRAERPRERAADYPSVVELPELLLVPHNQKTTRLWFAHDGRLLGFAFVDAFDTLRFELDWERATPALEAALVAWDNDCLTQPPASAPATRLYATSHEADGLRLACLERQAFARMADTILHLERSLATPIPAPQLPAGLSIRSVEGEHEAAELAALHRAGFGTPHMTTERRLAMMRMTHYDPALDLVAVTAGGTRAAYGMGGVRAEENALTGQNAGYTDLFVTHPGYRGQGLARALLLTLLHRLQARGSATAKLNTSSENAPMLQVAMSAGFRVVSRTLRFARQSTGSQPG